MQVTKGPDLGAKQAEKLFDSVDVSEQVSLQLILCIQIWGYILIWLAPFLFPFMLGKYFILVVHNSKAL